MCWIGMRVACPLMIGPPLPGTRALDSEFARIVGMLGLNITHLDGKSVGLWACVAMVPGLHCLPMSLALPPSLYADTARAAPATPPLQGDRRTSVAIVGGGFTGLSTA